MNEKGYEDMFESAPFFKFANVGDTIAGKVVEITTSPAKDDFPAQKVFTLELKDGTERRVALNAEKPFEMYCVHGIQLGDVLYRKFTEELPPAKKAWSPTKNFSTKYARDGKVVSPPFKWEKGDTHEVSEFVVKDAPRVGEHSTTEEQFEDGEDEVLQDKKPF